MADEKLLADEASLANEEPLADEELRASAETSPLLAAQQLQALLSGFAQLLRLELRQAGRQLPKLLLFGLLLIPLLLVLWLSGSALLSYLVYNASAQPGLALASFFVLQLIACVLVLACLARWKHQLSLPETRGALNDIFNLNGNIRDETATTDSTAEK